MSIEKKYSVLLVDDEIGLLEVLEEDLREQGFYTVSVASAAAAREKAEAASFDVLLTDLRMPGGDGLELVSQLLEAGRCPPVVAVMSGHIGLEPAELAAKGVDLSVPKPFDSLKLAGQLRELLRAKPAR